MSGRNPPSTLKKLKSGDHINQLKWLALTERKISLEQYNPLEILGINNKKYNLLKDSFPKLRITARGNNILVSGNDEEIDDFAAKMEEIKRYLDKYGKISYNTMEELLNTQSAIYDYMNPKQDDALVFGRNGRVVKAKTANQRKMVGLSEENDVVFAIGPAGTGKTYTAVALAVRALKNKIIQKIILTRPAVEAGESLGFLPGDLKEKIDPYLRPLYDALDDMIPHDKLNNFMATRTIEIAPLAFMRGRTLDNAFIILDEAQNCTEAQLKMFLTRLGPAAKCIITGDMTQVDLPRNQKSGLEGAVRILKDIEGIGYIELGQEDVIRHKLVKKILSAYNQKNKKLDDTLKQLK